MNIFVLDTDPIKCASYHCDRHVVKMILEYAQLLSTTHRELDGDDVPDVLYKKTHVNHPCAIWTRQTSGNYQWLYSLFVSCCLEYTKRYHKIHKTQSKLLGLLLREPRNLPSGEMTPFALAMPDQYKSLDPVESYRNYYRHDKRSIATWKTEVPEWFNASSD